VKRLLLLIAVAVALGVFRKQRLDRLDRELGYGR